MTAYTAVQTGNWVTPATWGTADYPDDLNDTADLVSYTVNIDVNRICGAVDCGTGNLTINTDKTLELGTTGIGLDVPAGSSCTIEAGATVKRADGLTGQARVDIKGTWSVAAGAHLQNLTLFVLANMNISDVYGGAAAADQLTCTPYAYAAILTMNANVAFYGMWAENATLIINAGVTLSCAANAWFGISANTIVQANGTRANPIILKCYTAGSKWVFRICASPKSNWDYVTVQDLATPTMVNSDHTTVITFTRRPRQFIPPRRPPNIDEDDILGRKVARTHYKGNRAAHVEISGFWVAAEAYHGYVDELMNLGETVGFASEDFVLPCARILDHDCMHDIGKLYWPYTLVLLEVKD